MHVKHLKLSFIVLFALSILPLKIVVDFFHQSIVLNIFDYSEFLNYLLK